jgi:broad specificity phosphatase PhoE
MRLFLIRHSQGHANHLNLVSGDKNDCLTSQGKNDAINLRILIDTCNFKPNYVISSDWNRAKETANLLFPNMDIQFTDAFGETNSGDDANIEISRFNEMNPNFFKSRANKYRNGESHEDMNKRVILGLNKLVLQKKMTQSSVAIVTHAGPITSILQYFLKVDINENFPAFLPLHSSISQIALTENFEFHKMIFFSLTNNIKDISCKLSNDSKWP